MIKPAFFDRAKTERETAALIRRIIELAAAKNLTIAACESFTAGLFCAEFASVPGASAVLAGGLVTYDSRLKTQLAHVSESIIEQYGVVSSQCARAMASGVKEALSVDIGISFTGNAGPSALEMKPAGLVYIALDCQGKCESVEIRSMLSRNDLRSYAVLRAVQLIAEHLEKPETD